ncbi:MAG TPA: RbsD/FucU domain-containing protein [Candidatus Saccharimonadales bacterium]|nr:RbsD/FucU domain-containing protein [Candidatus Saccharimonadales bacterium]
MPPLKGIDRGINGVLLKALEETGHGDHIAIVDPSYSIPEGARIVDYQGNSSARALKGILALVPIEDESHVLLMMPDTGQHPHEAVSEFEEALGDEYETDWLTRYGKDNPSGVGFYDLVNNPVERAQNTLFVRTRDEKAFACAMIVVGNSQS